MAKVDTTIPTDLSLVSGLHHYLLACEDEAHKARQARNREIATLYADGAPVSQLAEIVGMTPKAIYLILDAQAQR
ncbi:MAG TPA: hypothetical protein VIG24_07565 [Acidimicrobiia bacterium]